jgi:hypothetical protein
LYKGTLVVREASKALSDVSWGADRLASLNLSC